MRVAFYTNATATDCMPVLERLGSGSQQELVRIYLYDTWKEAKQSPLKILREFGWRRVVQKLVQLVSERWRRAVGKIWPAAVGPARSAGEWAERQGVPCRLVADLNHPAWVAELLDEQVDVLLVCICKNILGRAVLEAPRLGGINIHPSLLPKYRGPMPIFWMLYHGDSQAGVTFQWMTERIDAGPILAQFAIELDVTKSEAEVSRDLFGLAAEQLENVLGKVSGKSPARVPESAASRGAEGSYYSYPTKDDVRELEYRRRARR